MTCYSMACIKIHGRVVKAAVGFVTSVLAWLLRLTAHAVRGVSFLCLLTFSAVFLVLWSAFCELNWTQKILKYQP